MKKHKKHLLIHPSSFILPEPQAAICIKLPSRCLLAAGETNVAIGAHQEYAVRPAENGLESLAGRFRRWRELDNANDAAPWLHGIVHTGRGRCRLRETHGQQRKPGRIEQAEQCPFLPVSATLGAISYWQVRDAVASM